MHTRTSHLFLMGELRPNVAYNYRGYAKTIKKRREKSPASPCVVGPLSLCHHIITNDYTIIFTIPKKSCGEEYSEEVSISLPGLQLLQLLQQPWSDILLSFIPAL